MAIDIKKRGRPLKENAAKGRLEIRLTDNQKKSYVEAATKSGQPLAVWVRGTLDKASKEK